ncbi:flagellar assembly protein A [Malonomonas rubra]|uniref:flagellar assembly protein A n=1 Tax=Malonomonas rubra TaxID=57040 RepID=UPI0026ED4EAF|nr:flagellar assembly protein A [Malonomonas rubra]
MGIDFEAPYDFDAAVETGIQKLSVVLVKGLEPQFGEDGRFELMVKTSGEEAEFAEDKKGKVDLRTRHALTIIEVGQTIGKLHQPQEGVPGRKAHGLPHPAERGRVSRWSLANGVEKLSAAVFVGRFLKSGNRLLLWRCPGEKRNPQFDRQATGKIIIERGTIMGGACVALEGIETKVIGTSARINTKVTAGVYFPDTDRFAFLRESIKRIDRQIGRLKSAISPLEKLEVEREQFHAELAASTKQGQSNNNTKLKVSSQLLEGVSIHLGEASEKNKHVRKGPLTVIENTKDGGLRYLRMSPLQKAAVELEKEILRAGAKVAQEAAVSKVAAE